MLGFFKTVFATIVGLALFFGIFIIIGIAIIMSAMPEKKNEVSKNSILKLKLDSPITEREPDNFFSRFQPFSGNESSMGLIELKEAIASAKVDSSIKGIFLEAPMVNAGFATLQELRTALEDFKTSKKFVVAYGEFYTEKGFYLASVADKIYLPPTGMMELNGLESQLLFLKGALEKLELKPEIYKVGEYKSAVEPLILDKMSEPSRRQTLSFLTSINNSYLMDIAKDRSVDLEVLKNISDSMLVKTAKDAMDSGLITNMEYYDGAEVFMKKKLNIKNDEKLNFISYSSYSGNLITSHQSKLKNDNSAQIAVIIANGEIMSGQGDDNTIGSETLCEQLRKARTDENIKAVVLRINSPGGSALASDVIWREVNMTKKAKPIIASMSDVAASGGYYIAMACDTIVAQTTTITGSIGVFGITFNAENFLKNKLGITTDRVTTGKFSDIGSVTRASTEVEKRMIQNEVERIYDDFTTKAAEGRHMSVSDLRNVASGRVWSGAEGKENGLVDVYGGLSDAIKLAAAKANITDYETQYLPEQKNKYWNSILNQFGNEDEDALIKQLGIFYPYLKSVKNVKKLEGVQARLPFEIDFK